MQNFKIDSKEDCPCGSNIKYSNCCAKSKGNPIDIKKLLENEGMIGGIIKRELREAKFKICLHPDKEECSNKIIDAHTIQKSGILSKLSQNSHVIMLSAEISNEGVSISVESLGKSVATTYKMFCKKHDRETFKPIELHSYEQSQLQNFLYAYRAYASEYYKKMVQMRMFRKMVKDNPSILESPEFVAHYRGLQLAEKDANEGLEIFSEGISESDFSKVHTFVREIGHEISFAVSTAFGPFFDIEGNPLCISLGEEESRFPLMFLNAFPAEGKSYILFSCFVEDKDFFETLFSQLGGLSDKEFIKVMNNFIPEYTESLVLSPRLWERFSDYMKKSLFARVSIATDAMGQNAGEELKNKSTLFVRAPYNLFRAL